MSFEASERPNQSPEPTAGLIRNVGQKMKASPSRLAVIEKIRTAFADVRLDRRERNSSQPADFFLPRL